MCASWRVRRDTSDLLSSVRRGGAVILLPSLLVESSLLRSLRRIVLPHLDVAKLGFAACVLSGRRSYNRRDSFAMPARGAALAASK